MSQASVAPASPLAPVAGTTPAPKTTPGRAAAATAANALTHGVMSTRPVVAGVESPDEWEAHRRGVFESLRPVGHMEEACVNRIALLHWRLNRIIRFETEEIALAQEASEEEAFKTVLQLRDESHERLQSHIICLPTDLAELRDRLLLARHALAVLASLSQVPGSHTIPDDHAGATLLIAADVKNRPRSAIPSREPRDRWTASFFRESLASLAPNEPLADLIQTVLRFARDTAGAIERELAHVERLASRLRRQRVLPSAEITDRVAKYESHLTRQLVAYTREFESLVATRTGATVTKAHLHVSGLPETE